MTYSFLRRVKLLVLQSRGRNPATLRRPNTKLHTVGTTNMFAKTGYWNTPLRPFFFWLDREGPFYRQWIIYRHGKTVGNPRSWIPCGREQTTCSILRWLRRMCNTPQLLFFLFLRDQSSRNVLFTSSSASGDSVPKCNDNYPHSTTTTAAQLAIRPLDWRISRRLLDQDMRPR